MSSSILGSLQGKVAIVTGAGRGIGREYALALAAHGVKVAVADIADGTETAQAIAAAGGEAFYLRTDITSEADVAALAAETARRWSGVDILVNNAALYGEMNKKRWDELTVADWELMLRVNVIGMWLITRAVVPQMRQRGGGKVVNIASGVHFTAPPNMAHYNASKSAVVGLTRSLARELGDFGITVNAVSPGFVASEASRRLTTPDYIQQKAAQQGIIKRVMEPWDVVGTVLYLCSNLSDFLTGQNIAINGGAVLQ